MTQHRERQRIAFSEGRRITDRRCPHCDAFKAMHNPVEHTRDERPYLCLECGKSFASNCTEN